MADDGSAIRRRRQCPECGRRFTTVETTSLSVIKRSGVGNPSAGSRSSTAFARPAKAVL
ncbi:transcriptional repressor NrdR [Arthrobacter sp. Hiyo8]|nr:transcriptional repressor NrdR [Arthrobacter sp. Hiyo8]